MTQHDTNVRLRHMLDYAHEATQMVQGKIRTDLDSDRLLSLALVRVMEVIGEAATRVPQDDRNKYGDIAWSGIVGLRNRLVHGYDQINLNLLWKIIQKDIPPLIVALEKIPEVTALSDDA